MDDADPIDIAVGARIRIRRKQISVSQGELAEHLGVSFQQVQKYERGANRISASMLVHTAEKLQTTVGELVGEGADSVGDGEVLTLLASGGALDLLQAFAGIDDPKVRGAVLEMVRTVGASAQGTARRFGT
jgi:transcriptional regulator with XRE-family HTH domain